MDSPATITRWRDVRDAFRCYPASMTTIKGSHPRYFYQIIVNGHLDLRWTTWFDNLILTWYDAIPGDPSTRQTILSGPVADQAALHGLLHKIRDLNLELVAVTQITPPSHTRSLTHQVSQEQIQLVQHSFAQLDQGGKPLVSLFYTRLFALDPTLRTLFQARQAEQEYKFKAMLTLFIHNLPHLERLAMTVKGLGQRHVTYGVQPEHYALVQDALLWALAHALGEHFSPTVESAWRAAYALIVEMMQTG